MKENLTCVVAVLDMSGSMAGLCGETISGFNKFLDEQRNDPGEVLLTLATFNDRYELIHDCASLKDVQALDDKTYKPAGYTALLDAVGKTVHSVGQKLHAMKEEERPSKVIVLIMTDGEENSSKEFTHAKVMEMVKHQSDVYKWEFVFLGANLDAAKAGASIGVAQASSFNYSATSAGTIRAYDNLSKGVSRFRASVTNDSFKIDEPLTDEDAADSTKN